MIVPDTIEPFIGWRVWNVRGGNRLTLESLYYSHHWAPGRAARAQCEETFAWGHAFGGHSHRAPADGCKCGMYAAKTLEWAAEYLPEKLRHFTPEPIPTSPKTRMVFGRVALWGEVIEYEHGYRGEYAYPVDLYVPVVFECWSMGAKRAATQMRESYDVPVHIIRRAADVEVAA